MHAVIINGSPRIKKLSNTDKILEKFTAGMTENGTTFEQYEVSDKKQWEDIRKAFYENTHILIAIPLYVECIPGLLLEFLETLSPKNDETEIAFILQSGFAEGIQ
jgi:flavorubredoxin